MCSGSKQTHEEEGGASWGPRTCRPSGGSEEGHSALGPHARRRRGGTTLARVLQAMRLVLLKQRGRGPCKGGLVRAERGGLVGSELGSGLATPLVKESLRLEGWAAAAGTWEKAAAPPGIEPRRPGHKPPRAVRRGWTARGHCRRSTQATTGVRGRSSWKFLSTWVDERGDLGEQELGWDPPRVLSPQTSRLGGHAGFPSPPCGHTWWPGGCSSAGSRGCHGGHRLK